MATTTLRDLIIEQIERGGPLAFADYMRMALYEPGHGYYVSGAAKMGWEGDYFTSSDVSALFAHCLGRQLVQWWEKLKRPDPFIVLEQGAGRGNLAADVRAWAIQSAPELVAALDYRTEDIHLGQDAIDGMNAQVHIVLSNELIDAFPVHIVEARAGKLYEVYITTQDGHLCEVLGDPSTPELAAYLERFRVPWATFGDGWRAEISLDALRWLHNTARLIRRGYILTIDYGDKASALYTAQRPRGTLRGYTHHRLSYNPLAHPGKQDITAHVNFSALIDEGRQLGLRLHRFTTQRDWLKHLGIDEEVERRRASEFSAIDSDRASDRGQVALLKWYDLRNRLATLTDPSGMGNFKILVLRR
jgi:SAM-dependent MidA family methyltransferase